MHGKRVKVAVVVQEGVSVADAKSGDDHIDRLAHRYALLSELPVIAGGSHGKFVVQDPHDLELP